MYVMNSNIIWKFSAKASNMKTKVRKMTPNEDPKLAWWFTISNFNLDLDSLKESVSNFVETSFVALPHIFLQTDRIYIS